MPEQVLVCKNADEPHVFESVHALFDWVTKQTKDLGVIRDFLLGGPIVDSAGNYYSLADLPN